MRLFRTLFSFMIVAAIGISLITTCPTKTEFAKYYVSQSESKLGGELGLSLSTSTDTSKELGKMLILRLKKKTVI